MQIYNETVFLYNATKAHGRDTYIRHSHIRISTRIGFLIIERPTSRNTNLGPRRKHRRKTNGIISLDFKTFPLTSADSRILRPKPNARSHKFQFAYSDIIANSRISAKCSHIYSLSAPRSRLSRITRKSIFLFTDRHQ